MLSSPTFTSPVTLIVAVASFTVASLPTSMPPVPFSLVVTVRLDFSVTSSLPFTRAVFSASMVAVDAPSISASPVTFMPPLLESTSSFAPLVAVSLLFGLLSSPTFTSPVTLIVALLPVPLMVVLPATLMPPVPPSMFCTVSVEPFSTSSVPRFTASFLPSSVPFRLMFATAPLSSLASVFTTQSFDVVTRSPSSKVSFTDTTISVCVSARMSAMIALLSARPSSTWFAMMVPAAFRVARLTRLSLFLPTMTMWLKPISPLLVASVFFVYWLWVWSTEPSTSRFTLVLMNTSPPLITIRLYTRSSALRPSLNLSSPRTTLPFLVAKSKIAPSTMMWPPSMCASPSSTYI